MQLMTTAELTHRSETELAVLFGMVSQSLVRSDRGTPERRNALASLENISRRGPRVFAPVPASRRSAAAGLCPAAVPSYGYA